MTAPLVVQALWLILPAYIANMLAVLVGGGPPVDGGRNWGDGRRVLGDGKTWRGLIVAPVLTVAASGLLRWIAQNWPSWGLSDFGPAGWWLLLSWALATGALLGDMVFSFLKRRRGIARGESWPGPDQLDFIVGSWVFALMVAAVLEWTGATASNWFLDAFDAVHLIIIAVATPALHLLVNYVGYRLKLKEVPW